MRLGLGVLVVASVLAAAHAPAAAERAPERFVVGFATLPDLAEGDVWRGARVVAVDAALRLAVVEGPPRGAVADAAVRYVEPDLARPVLLGLDGLPSAHGAWTIRAADARAVPRLASDASVCVVDTGVRTTHEDLDPARLGATADLLGTAGQDPSGHGTAVAGVAAATTDVARGLEGVADVRLHAAKAVDAAGSAAWSDVARAVRWCADLADERLVVLLSLGADAGSPALRDAVQYAAARGRLVVAAAGNGACDGCVLYPARYPEVVAVGCTTRSDAACPWTSAGPEVELAAPGERVPTLAGRADAAYDVLTGTSASAAHVAGAAALLWDVRPDLAAQDVRARLAATARDVGPSGRDDATGAGRLDAACLVTAEGPCATSPAAFPWTACDTGSGGAGAYSCSAFAGGALALPTDAETLALADGGAVGPLALPFPFPFFGAERDAVWVAAGGFVAFEEPACACPRARLVPSPDGPDGLVAGLWTELRPSGGAVRWATLADAAVVEWREVPRRDGALVTFQVVLRSGGAIEVRLVDVPDGPLDAAVGVEDPRGAAGARWRFGDVAARDVVVRFDPPGDALPPGAPGPVRASVGGAPGEVALAWPPAPSRGGVVEGYRVWRAPSPEGPWTLAGEAAGETFLDAAAPRGRSAAWRVSAWGTNGEGESSRTATLVVPDVPAPPAGVVARPGPWLGSVAVSWSASASDDVVGYVVSRDGSEVARLDRAARGWTDVPVAPLLPHRYAVAAVGVLATGPPSAPACAHANPWPFAGGC